MHKPDYIKMELPVSKTYHKTAAKAYLKSLRGQDVCFRFGEKRNRKTFFYTIVNVNDCLALNFESGKKQLVFELVFNKQN